MRTRPGLYVAVLVIMISAIFIPVKARVHHIPSGINETSNAGLLKKEAGAVNTQPVILPKFYNVSRSISEKLNAKIAKTNIPPNPVDKYWENSIPATATYDYYLYRYQGGIFEVRYKVNGRTIGYREYKGMQNQGFLSPVPCAETVTDNCFLKHGPKRQFSEREGVYKLTSIEFYRANLKTGPSVMWFGDGLSNIKVSYYIDDREVTEQEYRAKALQDNSLAPPDIYKEERYQNVPYVNHLPGNLFEKGKSVSWQNLSLPPDAFKLIEVSVVRYGTPDQEKYITELFFTPHLSYGLMEVGERMWLVNEKGYMLIREYINLGDKSMMREWDKNSGSLTGIIFSYRENFAKDGKNENGATVGPRFSNGNVLFLYNNKQISAQEYSSVLSANPQYPPANLHLSYRQDQSIKQGLSGVPYAPWTNNPPLQVDPDPAASIWKGNIGENGINAVYVKNSMDAGLKRWYDIGMKNKAMFLVNFYGLQAYHLIWSQDGRPASVTVSGRYQRGVNINWDERGGVQSIDYKVSPNTQEAFLYATSGIGGVFAPSDLGSARLSNPIPPLVIPQAEMTPLMQAVMVGRGIAVNPPEEVEAPAPDEHQLGMEELNTLGQKINDLIEKSDAAFNKPYWQDNSRPQTSLQETNPKQESYELMHRAVGMASQAHYPANKAAFYMLISYKLADYSGRVFGNKAKMEFFSLAAQTLEKCGPIIDKLNRPEREKAELYVDIAEVWRNMTKKAFWGNHAYNKMDCDKKVIYYYEKALQTDPSYEKARTALAELRAPKPPVPNVVKALEPIPDQYWDEAQSAMQMINQGELIQPLEEKGNFIDVAEVFINTDGIGKIWLKRQGEKDWTEIISSPVVIYPFDAIKTSDDASGVSVTFASDKARLNIISGSIVQFEENYLYIQRGDVYVQVRKEGERFIVVTPSAGHGVRGTEFEVCVAPDKTTTTYLYSGVVEVRNQTSISYLTPGEKLVAKAGEDVFQQSAFNASQRKAANWENLIREAEAQQSANKPHTAPGKAKKPDPAVNAVWGSYSLNDQDVSTLIDLDLSSGKTPVGLQVTGRNLQILYLDQDLFKMTAWAIDWYANAGEIKNGISSKIQDENYFPMGISSDNQNLYVLYIKGETNPTAWQLVESAQNLQQVAADIEPWVNKGYLPVGISLHGQWYYTLLVQVQNSSFRNWEIKGYGTLQEAQQEIKAYIMQNKLPFGFIQEGSLYNVLYVGY